MQTAAIATPGQAEHQLLISLSSEQRKVLQLFGPVPMMHVPVESQHEKKEQSMADERDREKVDLPSSEDVKGEASEPTRPTSTDTDESVPQTAKDDLAFEDGFEATDN